MMTSSDHTETEMFPLISPQVEELLKGAPDDKRYEHYFEYLEAARSKARREAEYEISARFVQADSVRGWVFDAVSFLLFATGAVALIVAGEGLPGTLILIATLAPALLLVRARRDLFRLDK